MNSRLQIEAHEIIEHKGDLIVEGNIGEGAQLTLYDGSLTVGGNIGKGAIIRVKISKQVVNDGITTPLGNPQGVRMMMLGGKKYQGNTFFILGDNDITIDGVKISSTPSNSTSSLAISPLKVSIQGSIEQDVILETDAIIEIQGNIGSRCRIISHTAGLSAHDIGRYTRIEVKNGIQVHDVKNHCVLKSDQRGLSAHHLGQGVNIQVRDHIQVADSGTKCMLTSDQSGLTANDLGQENYIRVRHKISVDSIADRCRLISQESGIHVHYQVGNNVELEANDDITLDGNLGDTSHVESYLGCIDVKGQAGEDITLEARKHITLKDIGRHASVVSSKDGIHARNLGAHVSMTCQKDINIDGSCPNTASLTSQQGKVKKKQPHQAKSTQNERSMYFNRRW
jgi:hypothetical protein